MQTAKNNSRQIAEQKLQKLTPPSPLSHAWPGDAFLLVHDTPTAAEQYHVRPSA